MTPVILGQRVAQMGEDDSLLVIHVRLLQLNKTLQLGGELVERDHRIHQDHLDHLLELATCLQQLDVLLLQPVGNLPLYHPVFQVVVIDKIFLGMVVLVRNLPQIVDDVAHQKIADGLLGVNGCQLLLEQLQQSGDVEVILVQTR